MTAATWCAADAPLMLPGEFIGGHLTGEWVAEPKSLTLAATVYIAQGLVIQHGVPIDEAVEAVTKRLPTHAFDIHLNTETQVLSVKMVAR